MFSPDFTNYGLRRVTAKQFTQTLPRQTKVVTKNPKNKKLPPQPPIEDDEEDDNNSQISKASNSSAKTRQRKGQKTQNNDSVDENNFVTSEQDVTDDFMYYCSKCSYKIDEVTKFDVTGQMFTRKFMFVVLIPVQNGIKHQRGYANMFMVIMQLF